MKITKPAPATIIAAISVVLLVVAVVTSAILYDRARDLAPQVVEELAVERQDAMQKRFSARVQESLVLAAQVFGFLRDVWDHTESLTQMRRDLNTATTQMRALSDEVKLAMDSPTKGVVTLLENGPARASAVLDAAVAVGQELQRLVPLVLASLERAQTAANAPTDESLSAILEAMDSLLDPFIRENERLTTDWNQVRGQIVAWAKAVEADFETVRRELSGEALSAEFTRRLADRMF